MQAHASESSRQAALEARVLGLQQQLESRQEAADQLKGELAALDGHHKQVSRHEYSRTTATSSNCTRPVKLQSLPVFMQQLLLSQVR